MKTEDNQRLTHILTAHQLVKDCTLFSTHLNTASHTDTLWAWVALSAQGITLFREQGRNAVITALRQALQDAKTNMALPVYWRFSDNLPRDHHAEISTFAIEKQCLQPQRDPIWLEKETTENGQIMQGKVPLDLDYFSGHFAHFPLVPGVIELQWVIEQIHHYFGKTVEILRVDNLKFQKFLRPNDHIELTLKWDQHKNRMGFQLKTSNEMCGSGLIIIQ